MLERQQDLYPLIAAISDKDQQLTSQKVKNTSEANTKKEAKAEPVQTMKEKSTMKRKLGNLINWISNNIVAAETGEPEENSDVEKVICISKSIETAETGEPEEDSEVEEVMEDRATPPHNSFLAKTPPRTPLP